MVMWSLCVCYVGMSMLTVLGGTDLRVLPHLIGPIAICFALERACLNAERRG
jgi:hypothetical protein